MPLVGHDERIVVAVGLFPNRPASIAAARAAFMLTADQQISTLFEQPARQRRRLFRCDVTAFHPLLWASFLSPAARQVMVILIPCLYPLIPHADMTSSQSGHIESPTSACSLGKRCVSFDRAAADLALTLGELALRTDLDGQSKYSKGVVTMAAKLCETDGIRCIFSKKVWKNKES